MCGFCMFSKIFAEVFVACLGVKKFLNTPNAYLISEALPFDFLLKL
jgi:hypothetical protein